MLGLTGHLIGWAVLAGAIALDACLAHLRIALFRYWFEDTDFDALRPSFWERLGTPLWMILHGLIELSTPPLRGITCQMNATEIAEVVHRDTRD